MKKTTKRALKLLFGVSLLGIIVWRLDLTGLWWSLKTAKLLYIVGALSVSLLSFYLNALVFKYLTGAFTNLELRGLLKANFSTIYLSHVLPSRVGGLLGKPWITYSFNKEKLGLGQSICSTIIELIISNSRKLCFGLIALALFFSSFTTYYRIAIAVALSIYLAFVATLAVVLSGERIQEVLLGFAEKTFDFLPDFDLLDNLVEKLRNLAGSSNETLKIFKSNGRRVLNYTLLIVLLQSITQATRIWLIFKALGVSFSYWSLIVLVPMVYSVTVIPVSIGGLGVTELSGLFAFTAFGLQSDVAFAGTIIDRFISVYLFAVIGSILTPFVKIPNLNSTDVDLSNQDE